MKKSLIAIVATTISIGFSSSIAQNPGIEVTGNFNHNKQGETQTATHFSGTVIRCPDLKDLWLSYVPDTLYVKSDKKKDYLVVRDKQTQKETIYNFNGIWMGRRK